MQDRGGDKLPVSTVIVAHELKSPLLNVLQLARELQAQTTDPAMRDLVGHMIVSAESGLRFAQSLTHADAFGEQLVSVEPVRSDVVLHEVRREIEALAHATHVQVDCPSSRSADSLTLGNKDIIRAILMGLCDNAIKHAEPSRLRLSVKKTGGQVRFCVRNDGTLPNARAQDVESRSFVWGQSGLGLWIANQLAATMNGTIGRTRHTSRGGSTYWLAVPESTQLSLL